MVTFRGILSLKTTIVTRNNNTAIFKQRHFQRLTGHETEQFFGVGGSASKNKLKNIILPEMYKGRA